MTSVKRFQVTFDCADPQRVARFWCEVLGYVVPPSLEEHAAGQRSAFACVDPSGTGPRLYFQRVPEGKVVKNRVHLDVRVGVGLVGRSASPPSRPSARGWSRSARCASDCCPPTTRTSRAW